MQVLAVAGQKGGSARTTTSTSLAVLAEMAGVRTVVFDLDPQASATLWRDSRDAEYPDVAPAQPTRLPRLLEKAAEGGCGLAVLDCPPNAESTTSAAIAAADYVLIPLRPSARDLAAVQSTITYVRDVAQKPYAVVLSACPTNTRIITDEIAAALAAAGIPLCPVRVHQRIAHYSHVNTGLTATECDPRGRAAEELAALWAWTSARMKLQTGKPNGMFAGKPATEGAA
jgi:chromosome partitioning protein